jgi:hypothetical protein
MPPTLPCRSLPSEEYIARHAVGMIRQDASLAMNRAAEVTILSILLHNWICIKAGGLGVALGARF